MNILTIPRKFTKKDDLIVIPRKDYEALLHYGKPEGRLKPAVKRRLTRLHKDVVKGKNLSPAFTGVEEAIRYLNSR
jgi:hypothetical protein